MPIKSRRRASAKRSRRASAKRSRRASTKRSTRLSRFRINRRKGASKKRSGCLKKSSKERLIGVNFFGSIPAFGRLPHCFYRHGDVFSEQWTDGKINRIVYFAGPDLEFDWASTKAQKDAWFRKKFAAMNHLRKVMNRAKGKENEDWFFVAM